MGHCKPSKTNVKLGFASVDIVFLGVTISHVTLSCSQYLYNVMLISIFFKKIKKGWGVISEHQNEKKVYIKPTEVFIN